MFVSSERSVVIKMTFGDGDGGGSNTPSSIPIIDRIVEANTVTQNGMDLDWAEAASYQCDQ